MNFEQVKMSDLREIMDIERAGFNKAEAGTEESYSQRIKQIPDSFLVARQYGKLVGFICGPVTNESLIEDWMYEDVPQNPKNGGHQMILTIAVSPESRGQGIGSKLLDEFEKKTKLAGRVSIALTCLQDRIPFYEKNGFVNRGIADSNHANETWYNMEKYI
ncbi:GNAT family N-acetyltransferase [Companilactobacillus ginsenosidimutans]|uniref:N-acetyltransferase domain-containing protein n=1 Tax=Companilactobacillus ginsenosidimutans TaxID=1007676 RepID=A0A0H4QEC2_9LACO|nr:GNAT family N-acetyltransferase [Companilactobacillus ginsenosidimutans]AKP66287.1 hypothetical protein ABM34_01125 [Companilactobacillus ginsenosidimutans]